MNKNICVILILSVLFSNCSDLFDPALENIRDKNTTYTEPNFGLGLLTNGYTRIPTNNWSFSDVATDDAVTNDIGNGYLKLATGQWTAANNAADSWTSCMTGIQYMNIVINEVGKMKFSEDTIVNMLFKERVKGEAFGLRALFLYTILQSHAGWVNGKLLGVPIFLKELTATSDFNLPRADFNACTSQIYSDLDSAIIRLPVDYVDIPNNAGIPSRYAIAGVTDYSMYNRCMGVKFLGLVSGRVAKAIRSQVALLAASPAFANGTTNGSNGKWEDAAVYAAQILSDNNKITGLAANGITWYTNTAEISGLTAGKNPPEVIWRGGTSNNNDLERDNFPPTLYGSGRINPTQNLVDAFPTSTGYPITDPGSGYDVTNPYANRDPRLKTFILMHGEKAGVTNAVINIETGNDAVNKISTSTRTGYYMKKLLRQDVNYNPTGRNTQFHYKPRIRFTEIYLNYAEAANEAWGPLADPNGYGYSSYDVINAIRKRAMGLTTDPYLESIKNDQAAMRQLIRNERRLELCFEGFRFWDLRRWKVSLSELTAPAMGITVTGGIVSSSKAVENRLYQDYMYYGPIPLNETLKFSNLLQNDNWK